MILFLYMSNNNTTNNNVTITNNVNGQAIPVTIVKRKSMNVLIHPVNQTVNARIWSARTSVTVFPGGLDDTVRSGGSLARIGRVRTMPRARISYYL